MPNADAQVLAILQEGEIKLQSRLPYSSNNAFLVEVQCDGQTRYAIYKPARGERPLWDFDTGTLVQREVAAYQVSQILGFPNIPPTVLREGPYGIGAVQLFIDLVEDQHYFTLRAAHRAEMMRVAVFDALVNNTDRKGGHILIDNAGKIWCIDHGVTFHEDYKLRTVIWDYVDQPIPRDILNHLRVFRDGLATGDAQAEALAELLSRRELRALRTRADELIEAGVFPSPPVDWPHIPWPPI
ncbi:MAG: SCO1664 family protein [Chloroflexi bacterium]|nr:SCO1664 family protein [Chloroflexota bacterium]